VFAYVGLLIDFFMQMIFFVTVLSIDIRRMELSDLNRQLNTQRDGRDFHFVSETEKKFNHSNHQANVLNNTNADQNSLLSNRFANKESPFIKAESPNSDLISEKETTKSKNKDFNKTKNNNYTSFFANKSVQFFYFWARTRIVQHAIILLTILWIILICYKSLLIVELMRYDVNVKKETVEALLPKGKLNNI